MPLLFSFIFSLLLVVSARAQERVVNVRVHIVDSSQLEIRYDLVTVRSGDSVYVSVESRLRGELVILPEYIRGDLGKRITAGADRRIIWNALANGYSLNEDIRATIFVKALPSTTAQKSAAPDKSQSTETIIITKPADPEKPSGSTLTPTQPNQRNEPLTEPAATILADSNLPRRAHYAGPAWAILSAVAPGIGNIFVQTPKPRVGFRPLLTIGCYGSILYGLIERQKSQDEYAVYEQQKNMAAAEPYYQQANSHHQNYYLATRGAVIVTAVDVILTFIRGLHNNRPQGATQRNQPVTWRPGIQAGQPTAVVRFSF